MTAGARGGGRGESAMVPPAEAPALIPKSSGLPPQPRNIGLVTTISSPDDAAIPGHSYTVSSLQNHIKICVFLLHLAIFFMHYCGCWGCHNLRQGKRESWRSTTIITKGEKGSENIAYQAKLQGYYINLVMTDLSKYAFLSDHTYMRNLSKKLVF